MDVGILISDLPTSLRPRDHFDAVLRQVEAAQRNGLKYLLIGQHFVFPESRWLQPVPLLARLSAEVDPDVRLVTTVLIAPVYPPVLLAEELATLDIVSEGRLVVGLGAGYVREEFAAFGVPYEERFARLEECVAVLEALWTSERVTFHGRFTTLDDVPVMTRPVQQPRPPLWLGAMSDAGVRRAARLGDAWIVTPTTPAATLPARFAVFAAEREGTGRPMGRMPLRREIVVGRDRDDALSRAAGMGRVWYDSMIAIGSPHFDRFPTVQDWVRSGFVCGSAADVAAEIRAIGDRVPVDPVLTRAHWPGMTSEQAVANIDSLGRELVPALRDYAPVPDLPEDARA
jgi:alkanesulfonate monooxygenase SsuD/methylene tetrahydromethanopterin reductase-like flavin-dependent oxidoreductase (luciferase family)